MVNYAVGLEMFLVTIYTGIIICRFKVSSTQLYNLVQSGVNYAVINKQKKHYSRRFDLTNNMLC